MSLRIFRIVIVIAIALWIAIYIIKDSFSNSVMISATSLSFLVFSIGIHGLRAHSIRPLATKGELIPFPLFMWVIWAVMFLIIPLFCPDFFMNISQT